MVSLRGSKRSRGRRGSKLNIARNPPIPRPKLTSRPPVKVPEKAGQSIGSKLPTSPVAVTRPIRPSPINISPRPQPFLGAFGGGRRQKKQPIKAVPRRSSGTFGVDFVRGQPTKFTGRIKGRPTTRVTVASPSGRGKTITVSSRSVLASSGRKKRPRVEPIQPRKFAKIVTKARGKKVVKFVTKRPKRIPPRERRSSFGSDFDIFNVGRSEEIVEEGAPRRRRSADEEFGSDFDVLNFFA